MELLSEKGLVLIVEDNVATLDLLVQHLSGNDFETITARSGPMALKRARHVHPDLVLLDVMLPEMDGFEICRQLKSDPRTHDIPVIFMTVLSEKEDILKGFAVGGADYVAKPFHMPEVVARVNAHLARYCLRKALGAEIQRRKTSEDELRRLYIGLQRTKDDLEQEVEELTRALADANVALESELARREQERLEKDKLFALIKHQNQQLSELILSLVRMQKDPEQARFAPQSLLHQITRTLDGTVYSLNVMYDSLSQNPYLMTQSTPTLHYIKTATETLTHLRTYLASVKDNVLPSRPDIDGVLEDLSGRERQVLATIAQGHTTEEIATLLNISTNTVYTYRRRIMEKLHLDTAADLLRVAVQVSTN